MQQIAERRILRVACLIEARDLALSTSVIAGRFDP
jgi:hypothetical protein